MITGMSYGGGINGSAMLVGMKEKGIEPPDYIIFADTAGSDPEKRGEKPETYDYVDRYMRPWVVRNLDRGIITVGHWRDSLRESCFRNGTLPSKSYGFPGCSVKFKHQIMERYETQTYGPDQIITKIIGYHAGEKRGSGIFEKGRYRYRYLLKEWGWGQQECLDALERAGLPIPMKSACYFCPSSKPHEIIWLRDTHPDLFEDALAMERNAIPYHTQPDRLLEDGTPAVKGLGRKFAWSQFVNITPAEADKLPEPDQIPCMCNDGGDDE